MDPSALDPAQWALIHRALLELVLVAGLAMTAGASFVLGRAVLPTLVRAEPAMPGGLRLVQRGAYAAALLAALLTLVAFWRALSFAGAVLHDYYPRFLV